MPRNGRKPSHSSETCIVRVTCQSCGYVNQKKGHPGRKLEENCDACKRRFRAKVPGRVTPGLVLQGFMVREPKYKPVAA